jgi:hypothetical protein
MSQPADPFVYQPPNERTWPKYAEIREAEQKAANACMNAIYNITDSRAPAMSTPDRFRLVNDGCRAFYEAITQHAPPSADTSAALRCVRLARMAANEAIHPASSRDDLFRVCTDNLRAARWQACAAVALGDAASGG